MVLQMKEKDIDALLKDIPNSKSEEVKDKYILQVSSFKLLITGIWNIRF